MDRKKFIKSAVLGTLGVTTGSTFLKAKNIKLKNSDYDKMMEQVGFNHLPTKEEITMNTVLHKANTRGQANHGWLAARHSFSFASYHNPNRMHFGVLRVLNDDIIAPAKGFGMHPHDNMEIITIPLSGDLKHQDSMGNAAVIQEGDIQVMSAGTGVFHSEYNKNTDKEIKLLQIWLFPNKKNVTPRYDQISIKKVAKKNEFYQILSPSPTDQGVWIHQNAWFHLGEFDKEVTTTYDLKDKQNGLYVFVIEGEVKIGEQKLEKRDGFGIWAVDNITIKSLQNSKVLLMEVPLNV